MELTMEKINEAKRVLSLPSKIFTTQELYDLAIKEFEKFKKYEQERDLLQNYARNWLNIFLKK